MIKDIDYFHWSGAWIVHISAWASAYKLYVSWASSLDSILRDGARCWRRGKTLWRGWGEFYQTAGHAKNWRQEMHIVTFCEKSMKKRKPCIKLFRIQQRSSLAIFRVNWNFTKIQHQFYILLLTSQGADGLKDIKVYFSFKIQ